MDQYQIESHLILDTSWMHVANLARVAVEIIIIVGITTMVFSMDKDDKIVIESLEEWCEFMLSLCESKVDNYKVPIMSKPAAPYSNERGNFWGDGRHQGSWLKYENVCGVGGSVSLRQVVAAAYSLCVFVWPSYAQLSAKVEDLIMHRLLPDDDDDDHDGGDFVNGIEKMLEEGADGETYLRRMYLSLCSKGMVSANDCVLSGYFGCRQQCLYGCICFCLLLIGMYHGDCMNMLCIDWVNHIVLDGGWVASGWVVNFCKEWGCFKEPEQHLRNG